MYRAKAMHIGLCALLMTAALAAPAAALEIPPVPTSGVADPGHVLAPQARQVLEAQLTGYAQGTSARYAILVQPSLEGEAIEDYTIRVAEKWKVGGKKDDNGVLISVFLAERKVRIDVGYGLEDKLPDAVCARIIREQIAPLFRQGNIAGGLSAALATIDQRVTGREHVAPLAPRGPPSVRGPNWIGLILFLFFIVLPVVGALRGRRRGYGGVGGDILGGFIAGSSGWSSGSRWGGGDGGGSSWGGSSGGGFGGGGASGDW